MEWRAEVKERPPADFELGRHGRGGPRIPSARTNADVNRHANERQSPHRANTITIGAAVYIASPLFRRNAGTARSSCSKFAIMALRMLSRETTSADAEGPDEEARRDSLTSDRSAGSES